VVQQWGIGFEEVRALQEEMRIAAAMLPELDNAAQELNVSRQAAIKRC
jgi:hypothetical protein